MASDLMDSPTAICPSSSNLNRRSLSIFSRRGADTPTPATQTLAMASMSMAFANPPTSGHHNKQKRWRLSKDVKIPEGTILRMVPKDAPVVEMTSLEREMATSPNEEILRSIGMSGPESAPATPIQTFPPTLADDTNTSPRRYYSTRRERKSSQSDVIGVWKNGKAQWESMGGIGTENSGNGRPKSAYGTDTGSESTFGITKADKPKIQVVIPNNPSARRPFNFVPFFSRSVSEPASQGIAVSHTISQDISPPSVTSGQSIDSFQISAISPPTIVHKPIARRAHILITTSIDESPAFAENVFPVRPSHAPNRSLSNSSSSGSDGDDNASRTRSSRSSMTSIGDHPTEAAFQSRRGSSSSVVSFKGCDDLEYNKNQASVTPPLQRAASPIPDGLHMADFIDMMRSPIMQRPKAKKRVSSSRGALKLARIDSKEELRTSALPSPTLSEAERSLEAQLADFSQDSKADQEQHCMSSPIPEIFLSPAEAPPPPPPRRSSKRKARKAPTKPVPVVSSEGFSEAVEATQNARKIRQQQVAINQKAAIAQSKLRRSASVRSILSQVCEDEEIQPVDANAAETVVFHMLNGLQSLQDLFNTAIITKGFYRVFKAHELDLVRQVLRNQSSALWEYLEICRPNDEENEDDLCSATPFGDFSSATYIQRYTADFQMISNLKELLSERCQNLLRAETNAQLLTKSPFTPSSRVDCALWRIWSFCKIFGCNKGREDDLIAQMDWLRGGLLAHQESCSSTISTSDSFYISSVLLGAPDHFAKGNDGGLSAEELYDILEILNCISSIARSFLGQTKQARQFGVYDRTVIEGGDFDGEEEMLGKSFRRLHSKCYLTVVQKSGPITFLLWAFVQSSSSSRQRAMIPVLHLLSLANKVGPNSPQQKSEDLAKISSTKRSPVCTKRKSVRPFHQNNFNVKKCDQFVVPALQVSAPRCNNTANQVTALPLEHHHHHHLNSRQTDGRISTHVSNGTVPTTKLLLLLRL